MLDIPFLKAPSGPTRSDEPAKVQARSDDRKDSSDDFDTFMAEETDHADATAAGSEPEQSAEDPDNRPQPDDTGDSPTDPAAPEGTTASAADTPEADVFTLNSENSEELPDTPGQIKDPAGQPASELAFLQQAMATAGNVQGAQKAETVARSEVETPLNKAPAAGQQPVKTPVDNSQAPVLVSGNESGATKAELRSEDRNTQSQPVVRETSTEKLNPTITRFTGEQSVEFQKTALQGEPAAVDRRRQVRTSDEDLRLTQEAPRTSQNVPRTGTPVLPLTAAPLSQANELSVSALSKGEAFDLQPVAGSASEAATQWDPRSGGTSSLSQILARAETPTMVARQMAEVLQKMPDKPVELLLSPRELGKVRMSIAASENAITVTVLAERPETLDLMKRHIDQLAREFEALGYESINFAFSEGQQQADREDDDQNGQQAAVFLAPDPSENSTGGSTVPEAVRLTAETGVDIRL